MYALVGQRVVIRQSNVYIMGQEIIMKSIADAGSELDIWPAAVLSRLY